MTCLKVVELIGCSSKSLEDAINNAIKRANKTLRNITGAKVLAQNVKIKNGKIIEYRVNLKVVFEVE